MGADPERKERAEIDVVALCDDDTIICGECKWKAKPTDTDTPHKLQHRAGLIASGQTPRLLLFSKSGFTAACRSEAKKAACTLVSLKDMGLAG